MLSAIYASAKNAFSRNTKNEGATLLSADPTTRDVGLNTILRKQNYNEIQSSNSKKAPDGRNYGSIRSPNSITQIAADSFYNGKQ